MCRAVHGLVPWAQRELQLGYVSLCAVLYTSVEFPFSVNKLCAEKLCGDWQNIQTFCS